MTEPGHPVSGPSFKDRSVRLVLFGVLSVAIGGFSVLCGLLYLALTFTGGRILGTDTPMPDPRSYLMGALLYFLLGCAFAWVGVGSIRKRRWARTLSLTLAWTWLLSGAMTLPLMPTLLDGALAASTDLALDATLVGSLKIALMGAFGLFGVALPALFVLVYQDRNLQMTCEAYDPIASWTELCPPAVLGLSLGLGASGVIAVLFILRPMMPLFGWLATGWPAAGFLLIAAAASFWMARETYAMRMAGWWAASVSLTLLGISTWVTLLRVEPAAWYRAAGYPDELLANLPPSNTIPSLLTVAVTLLTVVYMVRLRKHFRADG